MGRFPRTFFYWSVVLSATILFCFGSANQKSNAIPNLLYKVANAYPHDPNAFTQGLAFSDGILYEGTGLRGASVLRKVKLETGDILQEHKLPDKIFGEGITVYGDKVIQLSWKSKVGFVYDKESFKLLKTFHYQGEGWGITNNKKYLIMSNGTARLRFLDPESFEEKNIIEVCDNKGPVKGLNELEYVRGLIYANVWPTERIARISPKTGQVTGWIEMRGLLESDKHSRHSVLNGIAYDEQSDRLFVTGKFWPKLFEIKVIEQK